MATAPKTAGIMALPENEEMNQGPQLSPIESYDAVTTALATTSPETAAQYEQTMNMSLPPELLNMSAEEISQILQLFQYLQENPDQYASAIAELIKDGVIDEGDLPAEYDEEVLATVTALLLQALKTKQGSMAQAPQGFAMGGIADAARAVASQGRSGDTILAHITPAEAAMLRQQGGMGTINPVTGLREYGFFKSLFKGVTNIVKSVVKPIVNVAKQIVKSPIGRIVATVALTTILGPAAAAYGLGSAGTAALVSGGLTALSGGDLKQVLTSSAISFLGAPGGPVGEFLGGVTGVTSVAGRAALASTAAGTAAGLLGGQSLKDSVKGGLQQAAIGVGTTVGLNYMSQPVGTRDLSTAIKDTFASVPPSDTIGGKVYEPEVLPEVLKPADVAAGKAAPVEVVDRNMPRPPGGNVAPVTTGASFPSRAGIDAPIALTTKPPGTLPVGGYRPNMNPMAQAAQNPPPVVPVESGIGSLFNTVKTGAENLYQGGKDFYNEYLSPSEIASRGEPAAHQAGMDAVAKLPEGSRDWLQKAVYEKASEAARPGMLAQYGPLTAAGLGSLALMGGFEPGENQESELAKQIKGTPGLDLIKKNPREYLVQNMYGIKYTPEGGFAGYETPADYTNLYAQPVQRKAGGGIMEIGGYAAGGEVNLAEQLTPQSTPEQIMAAYQQFLGTVKKPDSQETRQVAVDYLREKQVPVASVTQAAQLYEAAAAQPARPVLTPEIAKDLMYRSMTTGAPTSEFDKYGGYKAVDALYKQVGGTKSLDAIPAAYKAELAQTVANTGVGNLRLLADTSTPLTAAGLANMAKNGTSTSVDDLLERGIPVFGYNPINIDVVKDDEKKINTGGTNTGGINVGGTNTGGTNTGGTNTGGFNVGYTGTNLIAGPAGPGTNMIGGGAGVTGRLDPLPVNPITGAAPLDLFTGKPVTAPAQATDDYFQYYKGRNLIDYPRTYPRLAATGGMMNGGIAHLAQGGYPRRTGQISGPGTEISDSIPAMLSDGEFVMTAKAVRGAGNGSRRAGAKKMYALMHQLERNAARG